MEDTASKMGKTLLLGLEEATASRGWKTLLLGLLEDWGWGWEWEIVGYTYYQPCHNYNHKVVRQDFYFPWCTGIRIPAAPRLDLAGEDLGWEDLVLGRERPCEGRWKNMEEQREDPGSGPGTNFLSWCFRYTDPRRPAVGPGWGRYCSGP